MTSNLFLDLGLPYDSWQSDVDMRGKKVEAFRNYADGDHPSNLTTEMSKLLRIDENNGLDEFNSNYCDRVIQAFNDRLFITSVVANMGEEDSDEVNKIVADILGYNEFDALQVEAHESAIRDGDAYMLVSGDTTTGEITLTVEPAFDGTQGMIVLYESMLSKVPTIAIKIWSLDLDGTIVNRQRVNVYRDDKIKRYIRSNGGPLEPYSGDGSPAVIAWPAEIGMPVRHLPNRKKSFNSYGKSEIEDVIPLQNGLNRALYSLVVAAELSGFQIRVAKGFEPPADLTPGMWVELSRDGGPLDKNDVADAYVLEGETPRAFIEAADWLIGQISSVSATPMEFLSASVMSGEALKQREIALLGKVKRFQVVSGAFWKSVIELALRVYNYIEGKSIEMPDAVQCIWRDPQIRNDLEASQIVTNVASLGILDKGTLIELMAPIFDWDSRKVEHILKKVEEEEEAEFKRLSNAVTPQFGNPNMQVGKQPPPPPEPGVEDEAEEPPNS